MQESLKYKPLKSPERSEKPNHDLILVDIRRCVLKRNCVRNYLTENVLQSLDVCSNNEQLKAFVTSNVDAALEVEIATKRFWVALEYENTFQSSQKMEKKIKKFYDGDIAAMLLICKTKAQLHQIQDTETEILKSLNLKSRIYSTTLDVLLSSIASISFESRNGKSVSLS